MNKKEEFARRLKSAEAFLTIIEFHAWKNQVDHAIKGRFNSPVEFLCLSVGDADQTQFSTLLKATECVAYCRTQEHDIRSKLEAPSLMPFGILVVTDPPPKDPDLWRTECLQREQLTSLGGLLLDRHEGSEPSDKRLCLETIVAAGQSSPSVFPNTPIGGFDFNWEPQAEVGPLGAEYGFQPPGVRIPKNAKEFHDQFQFYRPEHPDLEF